MKTLILALICVLPMPVLFDHVTTRVTQDSGHVYDPSGTTTEGTFETYNHYRTLMWTLTPPGTVIWWYWDGSNYVQGDQDLITWCAGYGPDGACNCWGWEVWGPKDTPPQSPYAKLDEGIMY
jgi:hypothetical protein